MDSVSSTQRIAFFMLWEPPNVEIGYGLLFSRYQRMYGRLMIPPP